MLCPKCNQPVADGKAFCGNCGASLADVPAVENAAQTVDTPAEAPAATETPAVEAPVATEAPATEAPAVEAPATETPNFNFNEGADAPAKKSFKFTKTHGIAVVAVVLVLLIVCNISSIGGFFVRTFGSPEANLKYTYMNALNDGSKAVLNIYDNYRNNISPSTGGKGSIDVAVGDDAIEMLETLLAYTGEFDDVDLGFLSGIGIGCETTIKDNKMFMGMTAKISGKEIVDGRVYVDADNGVIYVGLPDYQDQYIMFEIPEEELANAEIALEDTEAMLAALDKALPTSKQINKCLTKYVKAAANQIDDVSKDKTEISVGDIDQKVKAYTLEITPELMDNISVAVLEEIVKDKDLEKIINNIEDVLNKELGIDMVDYETMMEEVQEEIDYYNEKASEQSNYTEAIAEFTTYVNNKGEFAGCTVAVEGYDGDKEEVSLLIASKGNKFNLELKTPGDEFSVKGEGKKTNSKLEGDFNIYVEGDKYCKLTLSDFNTKKFTKGELSGTVILEPSSDMYGDLDLDGMESMLGVSGLALKADFAIKEKSAKMGLAILKGDENFVSIDIDSKITSAKKVNLPKDTVGSEDIMEWAEDFDFAKLVKNLEKAGVPDVFTELIEEAMEY